MSDIQVRFSKISLVSANKNIRFYFIVSILILLGNYNSFSQAWTRILSQPSSFSSNIIRFNDGGYLVCGGTNAYGPPSTNAMMIKLDSLGNWQWQVVLGGVITEYGFRAIQNAGGDIFVVSSPYIFGSDTNGSLLTRLSSSGQILWTISLNTSPSKLAYDITDSGYDVVITGAVNNHSTGTKRDLFISKIDTTGSTLWTKTYGGLHTQIGNCISKLNDGGYLIGGGATSFTDSTTLDCFAVRTDSNGDTLWTRHGPRAFYDGRGSMGFYGCTQLKGDTLVVFTSVVPVYYPNACAVTYRMDGTLKFQYISSSLADGAYDVCATNDGGFMMAGYSLVAGTTAKIFKFSHTGKLSFTKGYFGLGGNSYPYYSNFNDLIALPDGSLIAVGTSSLFENFKPSSYGRMLIMKTTAALNANIDNNGIITTADSTSFCIGNSITLNAMTNFDHYQWFWFNSSNYVNWIPNSDTISISADSSGTYTCLMWNDNVMSYSNSILVRVSNPPDTTIYSTGSLLHCAQIDTIQLFVKSQPYTSYQWYLNGNPLLSTTNKITPLISGVYSVKVANSCDTLTTAGIFVDVNATQSIVLDTNIIKLPYLSGATSTCKYHKFTVPSLPNTTYTWYRNNLPTGSNQATDSVNKNGYYYLTAQNVCGISTSNIAQVVYDSIKLTLDTNYVTSCDNHSLFIKAPYNSYYYEWFKNGVLVSQGSNNANLLPGWVLSNSLDTGYYKCRVSLFCNGTIISGFTDSIYYAERNVTNYITIIAGSNPSCNFSPVTLQASIAGAQYQWYRDSVLIFGATSQSYTAFIYGIFTVEVTLPCGVISSSVNIQFGIPNPAFSTITFDSDTMICKSSNSTRGVYITANSFYQGGQWQLNGVDIPNATYKRYYATSAGWYRYLYTNACGSDYTNPFYVPESVLPDFQLMPAGTVPVCPGDSVILSLPLDTSYSYKWYKNGILLNGIYSNSISVVPQSYYHAVVTNNFGCTNNSTYVNVTYQILPINNILPFTPPFICEDSIKLSANERYDYSYQWYKNSTPIPGATQKFIYATEGADFSVRIYDSLGCYSDAQTLTVEDSAIGTPSIVSSNLSHAACLGDSVILSVDAGFANYQWYINGSIISGATSHNLNVNSTGNYSVEVRNLSGCTGTANFNFVVSDPPLLIQQNIVAAQCSTRTGSFTLTFDTSHVRVDLVYADGSTFTQGPYAVTTYSFSNLYSGWYVFNYTHANGSCFNSDSIFIPSSNILTPNILLYDTIICAGETAYLNAGLGPALYSWNTGVNTSGISVTLSGMYSVTVTDTISGCVGVDSMYVTVNPLPTISISPSGPIGVCVGNSIVLDAGSGNYSYAWSSGDQSQLINATASGIYVVTVIDTLTTCVSRDSTVVTFNSLPTISIWPNDTAWICASQLLTLHCSSGYASYLWSNGITDSLNSISTPGWYSVLVSDSNFCYSVDSVYAASSALPIASITPPGPHTLCDGNSIVLNADSGSYAYAWSTGQQSQTINVAVTGNYILTVTNTHTSCVNQDTAIVNIYPPPLISIWPSDTALICASQTLTLNIPSGYASYLWSTGLTDSIIYITSPGWYSVQVGDSNLCYSADSVYVSQNSSISLSTIQVSPTCATCCDGLATVLISGGIPPYSIVWSNGQTTNTTGQLCNGIYTAVVTDSLGCVDSVATSFSVGLSSVSVFLNSIQVFPNPTQHLLTIESNLSMNKDVEMKIANIFGQQLSAPITNSYHQNYYQMQIDISHFASGMYLLSIYSEGERRVFKIYKL